MDTISQRQLRNDNAAVIRDVSEGKRYIVTRRGVPVAQIGPLPAEDSLTCARPARTRLDPQRIRRVTSDLATSTVLGELRGER